MGGERCKCRICKAQLGSGGELRKCRICRVQLGSERDRCKCRVCKAQLGLGGGGGVNVEYVRHSLARTDSGLNIDYVVDNLACGLQLGSEKESCKCESKSQHGLGVAAWLREGAV